MVPVVDHLLPEGSAEKVRLEMHQPDGSSSSVELFYYHWLERTYRNAASTAGLMDISIQPGAICPRGYVNMNVLHIFYLLIPVRLRCRWPLAVGLRICTEKMSSKIP